MSDYNPDNQIVPMQTWPGDVDEEVDDFEIGLNALNTSTSPLDDPGTAADGEAAVLAILPPDNSAVAQQEPGLENSRNGSHDNSEQYENVQQSIENFHQSVYDDLEPGSQPYDHAYTDLEPGQQAQRTSRASIGNNNTMKDAQNQHETEALASSIGSQSHSISAAGVSFRNDIDPQDSSSLFVPEHDTPPQSPAPSSFPPRLAVASSRQTVLPVRQPDASKSSMFARVRDLHKRVQARKNALRNTAAYQPSADPDPEAYLEAVTSGTDRPAGALPGNADEMEHRAALADFEAQKSHYDDIKRQHGGSLPFRQAVEWMKIKGAEDARLKKRQRELLAAQEGDEQDLFPPVRGQPEEQDNDSDTGYYAEASSRKRRRGAQPSKNSNPTNFQAAEYQSMLVAIDANDDNPKKKRKGAAGSEKGSGSGTPTKSKASKSKAARPSRSKAAGKSAAKGPRRTAKDKRELERATKQATSLFNADVFEQQAGMAAADQPVFKTRNKAEALKELIASVPTPDKSRAKNDMNSLLQASKDFDGRGACKIADNGNWLVRGMSTSLKGYQVLGSAFMRRRENDANEPKGGLMADQMGLGKTLMMLANIVNSRDSMIRTKEQGPKTTLLVASPALLNQWASEIEQHTKCGMRVMRYGAGSRIDSTHASRILEAHDIVLTTYGEVMKSYPKHVPPIECQTAEEKLAWWKEVWESHRGVLHKMQFKRIVLDEAQAIKNHQSRTSIACRALIASHKWALSGTPILNGLDELYPYFKFLGVPHTGSFKIFKQNYCGSGSGESAERLLVRLSQFMIRRTHADRMFNAPILKLPQANQITHWCEFNAVERSIYNIVHQRFAMNINMLSKSGTLERSYNNVLVMLLRLRQLSAHVLMLQFVMRDLLERDDIEKIKEVVGKQAATSSANQGRTILAIRKQLEAHEQRERRKTAAKAARKLAAEEAAKAAGQQYVELSDDENEDIENEDEPLELPRDGDGDLGGEVGLHHGVERNKSGKAFGKSYNFKPYVNSLTMGDVWEKKKEQAKCGECGRQHLEKPWLTACGHIICDPCYEEVMGTAAEEGEQHATCKTCGSTFAECTPCDEAGDVAGPGRSTRNMAAQRRKSQQERMRGEEINNDWLILGGDDVLPSAKTLAVKAQILNWIRENPNVKIIVYTQFLAMIRILAKACQMETWTTEQYHGKQSLVARDKAIKNFADNPSAKVLLASLRCGGLGLNLTMASKVIIIDPWWNQASEQQAFCRVFRIGQQDETFMTRMCVRNTVDERLIEMQREKQKEIDEVMEDGGRKTKHLEIADLMRLFGNIEEADDGRPFIVVDDPTTPGGFFADQDHEGYADDF